MISLTRCSCICYTSTRFTGVCIVYTTAKYGPVLWDHCVSQIITRDLFSTCSTQKRRRRRHWWYHRTVRSFCIALCNVKPTRMHRISVHREEHLFRKYKPHTSLKYYYPLGEFYSRKRTFKHSTLFQNSRLPIISGAYSNRRLLITRARNL